MIKIHGKYIRNIPEQVGKNKKDISTNSDDIAALVAKINQALAGVFHYKGSVATYADLPASDNEVGDTYNVLDTGKNYAWDGSAWDDLGGLIDLSNYYTKTETDTLLAGKAGLSVENSFSMLQKMNAGLEVKASSLSGDYRIVTADNQNLSFVYYESGISATPLKLYSNGDAEIGGKLTATGEADILGSNYTMKFIADSNGNLYVYKGTTDIAIMGTTATTLRGDFKPRNDNAYDIGASSAKWKDLYLAGAARFLSDSKVESNSGGTLILHAGSSGLVSCEGVLETTGNIRPASSGDKNLGISTRIWNIGYIKELNNGTDSVTVEDLAALITYAKAQGWIS